MHTQSPWLDTAEKPSFGQIDGNVNVDVAIIGGGITGLTAGILLQRAGRKVAILEYAHIAGGETGHTTAHLTEVIDTRYHQLASDFGADGARNAARSSRAAIAQIERFISEYSIQCDFERVAAYLYTEKHDEIPELQREVQAMQRAGVTATLQENAPLPFVVAKAIEVPNQAQFNPVPYLHKLARELASAEGCLVLEHSRVIDIQDGEPCHVAVEGGHVTAQDVIVAANAPLNLLFLHTKLAAYRTYAIAAPLSTPPPKALCWDTAEPYHYIRTAPHRNNEQLLIVGGEDHKTGTKSDTTHCFEQLEAYTRERFGIDEVRYRWSGQIIEPADGLPYIGVNSLSKHVYVATGYSGNGMTFGTLAGMLLSDQILGKYNEWSALYDATRFHVLASAGQFISENKDYPAYFIKDRLTPAEAKSIESVQPNQGKLISIDGEKAAVFRDVTGELSVLSPVCPHLGCLVHWNDAEQTWDCPCHGSRFDGKGKPVNGPSLTDLKPLHAQEPAHKA
jgi:glycine/D-amino acid oxidase-like deaminating enzyme/nitrite reductase/ring-hydroxylating ferredoxin subunit